MNLWDINKADLSSKPSLMQGLLLEFLLKKVKDLLELTLHLIFVVLKSFYCIVVFIDVGVEEIIARANPWSAEKEEFVSGLVDKAFIPGGKSA